MVAWWSGGCLVQWLWCGGVYDDVVSITVGECMVVGHGNVHASNVEQ